MAAQTTMNHNGITLETSEPLPSMGGVDGQLGAMVGTAPNKDASVEFHEPTKLYSITDLKLIDTTEDPQGTLYYNARYHLEVAKTPLYIIVVPEGADDAATEVNIIGGVDNASGQLMGISAIEACQEAPTNIAIPQYSSVAVANALATVCDNTYAEGWIDATDTNTVDAKAFAAELGEAHKRLWCVDVHGERWSHPIAPSVVGMAARCSVKPWKSPNGIPVKLDDIARRVGYKVNNKYSEAVDLNKVGVSLPIADPNGGLMFLGTRTASGDHGNVIGIENQLCRQLILSHRDTMSENLDEDFFRERVAQVNNWMKTIKADGALIDATVYLHPERNTVDRYNNGEWVLVVDWGAYRPNEHSIIELNQVNSIVETYVEQITQG